MQLGIREQDAEFKPNLLDIYQQTHIEKKQQHHLPVRLQHQL